MWSVAATMLLLKTILWTRWMHYGFCLSLPATILLVMWMIYFIPQYLARRASPGRLFRLAAAALLAAAMAAYGQRAQQVYGHKTTLIRGEHDRLFALDPTLDPRVTLVQQSVAYLQQELRPDDTLAVVPEGVMLNFLTRHANPTPYISYMPPEMEIFGEARILAAWQHDPPDWVVLWPRNSEEYTDRPFGEASASGVGLLNWIQQHYDPVSTIVSPAGAVVKFLKRCEV